MESIKTAALSTSSLAKCNITAVQFQNVENSGWDIYQDKVPVDHLRSDEVITVMGNRIFSGRSAKSMLDTMSNFHTVSLDESKNCRGMEPAIKNSLHGADIRADLVSFETPGIEVIKYVYLSFVLFCNLPFFALKVFNDFVFSSHIHTL